MGFEEQNIIQQIKECEEEIARLTKENNCVGVFYVEERLERLEMKLKKLEGR